MTEQQIDKEHDDNIRDFKSYVLPKFINISHLDWGGSYGFGRKSYTNLKFCSCNEHYKDSQFYYKQKLSFVHFSNLEKAKSILTSNTIRLYNLMGMNDPNEYNFAKDVLGAEVNEENDAHQNLFTFSMCEEECVNNLNLWRLYGDDTKGIALIIDFEEDNDKWISFHLSQVYYGECNSFKIYKEEKRKLEIERNFKYNLDLSRFLCFYKKDDFEYEREIRLLCYLSQEGIFPKSRKYVKLCKSKREFIELPLANRLNPFQKDKFPFYDIQPKPKVRKIVLGANLDIAKQKDFLNFLSENLPEIDVEVSKFKGQYNV